jgi:hypothetical protein
MHFRLATMRISGSAAGILNHFLPFRRRLPAMSVAADGADPRTVAVRFILDAEPSPGLLSRLLQPFAKRDLVPDRMWAYRSATDLHAELQGGTVQALAFGLGLHTPEQKMAAFQAAASAA